MKKEIFIFKVFFICVVLTFTATNVHAEYGLVYSSGRAKIYWSSLSITGDIMWNTQNSRSYGSIHHISYTHDTFLDDFQDKPGWVDTATDTELLHFTHGWAWTTDVELRGIAEAILDDIISDHWWGCAKSYAYRGGSFTANSDGWVEFSADYYIGDSLIRDYLSDKAYGYAEAELLVSNSNTSDEDYDLSSIELKLWDSNYTISDSDSGTLTVSVWFNAGDTGQFQARAYDESIAIPEPATILLLGLGAVVLRKRK